MQGNLVRKWYCRFRQKEIKYFPQLVNIFQKDWVPCYEEVEYVQFLFDLQGRMIQKTNDLVMEYCEHPPNDIFLEIKERTCAFCWT